MALSVIGILIGLALLMYLAMRGVSVLILAPVCGALVFLTGGVSIIEGYTGPFMQAGADYVKNYFPMFFLGAVFGKIMEDSGAAASVARYVSVKLGKERAIAAVMAACAVLTYGGVSLFVVVFTMYPFALALFREAKIPKRLIPGCIALGSFTFTMTAIPGTPQIQNIIPINYLNTTPSAAPVAGLVGAVGMIAFGLWWMNRQARIAWSREEPLGLSPQELSQTIDEKSLPPVAPSMIPLISILVFLNLLKLHIVYSLALGCIMGLVLFWGRFKDLAKTLNTGGAGSTLAMLNTATAVGFGGAVRAVPGFAALKAALLSIPGPPLVSAVVAVNLMAGVSGSASGGLGIALDALAKDYLAMGVNPAALHRMVSLASGGLDTLPHNGAVVTLLAVCGITHKESYKDIFMVSLLGPLLASIPAMLVCLVLYP